MNDFNTCDYYIDANENEIGYDYHQAMALLKKGHEILGVKSELLLSDTHGIYIPQVFYNNFDFAKWNLNKDDFASLANPESESYWLEWDEVLRDAKHTDKDGITWSLEQDGDLFAKAYIENDWQDYL